jgi:hypothetical protein
MTNANADSNASADSNANGHSDGKRKRATRKKSRSRKSKSGAGASKHTASHRSEKDIRERVHDLTLRALRDRDLTLRDIPKLAQRLVENAAAGMNNAVPASKRNVLRQVVDGLTDAATATAQSTKSVATSTAQRGSKFIKHDAARTARDLKTIEEEFVSALGRAGKHLTGAAKEELDAIVRHSRRAGTQIKPAAKSVLRATDGHLLQLGKETASASGRIARSAVSSVLHGASGLLQGLGEVMEPKRTPHATAHPATKKRARRK